MTSLQETKVRRVVLAVKIQDLDEAKKWVKTVIFRLSGVPVISVNLGD